MKRNVMRRVDFAFLACGAVAAASFSAAQMPPQGPFQVHQLTPTIYWVEGGGGNTGIIVGDKGVVVIDSKTSPDGGKQLVDDVAKITPKPITTVILTHSDGDHTGGLPAFPKGVTIIAQDNDKKEIEAAIAAGGPRAPSPDYLPNELVTDKKTETIDGVKFELFHWAPAHTSGDLIVFLPESKIVFTGDIITEQYRPLVHLEKHGSSEGWITTVKGILTLNADQFVPGHGNPMNKDSVKQKLSDATAERAKIVDLVAQGKSLQEIEAAVGDPQPSTGQGGGGGPRFAPFSEVVYDELTKK
jgi:glyoxylase-like metal-dependent hydrolase (beta-lactamase superfamily II)